MTKRTRKTTAKPSKPSKPVKPAKQKGKVGGARPGSGPKPVLGAGVTRDVIKTLRLGVAENANQQTAVQRAGLKDWATWARPILNAAAELPAASPPAGSGAVVTGTDPCACGHSPEEHGRSQEYPGSTACRATLGGDPVCDCSAYEAQPEDEPEPEPDSVEAGEPDSLIAAAHAAHRGEPG